MNEKTVEQKTGQVALNEIYGDEREIRRVFILFITVLSTRGLGIHSINNIAFPVILIIGSLVVNQRVMALLTMLTVLCIVTTYWSGSAGPSPARAGWI